MAEERAVSSEAGLCRRSAGTGMLMNDTISQLVSLARRCVMNRRTPDSNLRSARASDLDLRLGRQPFGLASPAAWLRREGIDVRLVDIAKEKLDPDERRRRRIWWRSTCRCTPRRGWRRRSFEQVRAQQSRGAHLRLRPLRAAERGVAALARRRRRARRRVRRGALGDCARASGSLVVRRRRARSTGCRAAAIAVERRRRTTNAHPAAAVSRPRPLRPAAALALRHAAAGRRHAADRRLHRGEPRLPASLPPLPGRAGLRRAVPGRAARRRAGRHRRAGGRRRRHITFGDPDFFNGPTHALRIVEALHAAHPARHLRRHDQGRAPAAASRAPAAVCATPAACS